MKSRTSCLLAAMLLLAACSPASPGGPAPAQSPAPVYGYHVVDSFPHDPDAFTQGLLYHDGVLYESTGRDSELRKLRLETGEVLQREQLADRYFGEGLAVWRDRLVQLTWESGTGFVYDRASFDRLETFSYPGEGWGLARHGRHLVMSDGSDTLRFLDPETFEERRRVRVMDGTGPVNRLNELETVRGEIYANVYHSDRIARIAPDSGRVIGWIDLAGLRDADAGAGVLNGIAYDAEGDRLFITGKLWPRLFEIELVPR